MKRQHHTFIRGVILLGFTLLLFKLMVTGDIYNYIAPKMLPYFYFALLVFMILGAMQFLRSQPEREQSCGCNHDHTYSTSILKSFSIYLLFIIPVLTGFMFSDHTLGSSVAQKKGYQFAQVSAQEQINPISKNASETEVEPNTEPNQVAEQTNDNESLESNVITPKDLYGDRYEEMKANDKIHLNDDQYISSINLLEEDPESFSGKTIVMNGFIYREPTFPATRIVIGRFGVSCCVADAGIYGIMVDGDQVKDFNDDTWIEVEGTLRTAVYNDWQLPLIELESIREIQKPKQAYVYENIDYSKLEED